MDRQAKAKYSNELIIMRKKKNVIKRSIILSILLVVILITLCLKLSYFNIEKIEVVNNKIISSEEIVTLSGLVKGNNIFYINVRNVKNSITSNPYICDVSIRRELPQTIKLDVTERKAVFYSIKDNKNVIIDNRGIILEVRDKLKGLDLVNLSGINFNSVTLGKEIDTDDNRKIKVLGIFADLIDRNTTDLKISSIEISDLLNISLSIGKMNVKLGNYENIESKLNKALNIMQRSEVRNSKGYIDVSFEGNPVVYIEN